MGDDDDDTGGRGGSQAGTGGSAGKGGSVGTGGSSSGEGGEAGSGASGAGSACEGGGAGVLGAAGESGSAGAAGSAGSDTTAPVITLTSALEWVIDCGATYAEPGASALDDEDGVVDVEISGEEAIDSEQPGRFELTYAAEDASGNRATATRVVNVCGPGCGDLGKEPINLSA